MTLVIGWVRTVPSTGHQELILASDSRIRSGGYLDCAPKLFGLTRDDAAIAFAGDTYFGYPLVQQFSSLVSGHHALASRLLDYRHLRTYALRAFNGMIEVFRPEVIEVEHPDTSFLLAGYSWRKKEFQIDVLTYSPGTRSFHNRPCFRGDGNFGKIMFTGDWGGHAHKVLVDSLRERYGPGSIKNDSTLIRGYDWEPFVVLRDLLRQSGPQDTIGGPPQLMRITPYMECHPLGVLWPDASSGSVYLHGRLVLPDEPQEFWVLDPDSLALRHPRYRKHSGVRQEDGHQEPNRF